MPVLGRVRTTTVSNVNRQKQKFARRVQLNFSSDMLPKSLLNSERILFGKRFSKLTAQMNISPDKSRLCALLDCNIFANKLAKKLKASVNSAALPQVTDIIC